MKKLVCVIVGSRGSAFPVEIDASQSVGDLKKAIQAENTKTILCDARDLRLFLAKKTDGKWLTEVEVKQGETDTSGMTLLEYAGAPLSVVGFTKKAVRIRVTKKDVEAGIIPVHVLVKLPEPIVYAASLPAKVQLPTTSALDEPEKYAEECISLNDWDVNVVHKIPSIWRFMSSLGGCTQKGEIFWRMEDKRIVSLLVDGWFRESSPLANKKSIMLGSPGIGKSTLLCVLAFHLVFKHKMNVLVYRRLHKNVLENCLFYLGYEDGKFMQFAVNGCEDRDAINIYKELIRQQGISNVWLLLDGFRYQKIPDGVRTFKMLATSHQVDLKSVERVDAYCCLLPCWSRTDLFSMGSLIHNFPQKDMIDRFFYSGGSVREFTLAECDDIIDALDNAITSVPDTMKLLSNTSSISTEELQVDRLRHTFLKNPDEIDPRYSAELWKPFVYKSCWEHIIDSEYAARCLSVRLRSDELSRIYTWAQNTGNNSLTGGVFEILIHRLAADNQLELHISEYESPKESKPKAPRHLKVEQVRLEKHRAICSGTTKKYVEDLTKWRDDKRFSYWFPACGQFRNVDSIVKLKSTSGKKGNVAYLQFTVGAKHDINANQLKEMNKIFFPDDVKSAGDTEPPIYIAVCPDLETCKALVLESAPEVLAARKVCRVFVGYYTENKFGIAADGPSNDVLLTQLAPSSSHYLRKRPRSEK